MIVHLPATSYGAIIFTATAPHSAVNFGQYEYGGWVPKYALCTLSAADGCLKPAGTDSRPIGTIAESGVDP